MVWWKRSSREAARRERSFVVNGGLLQEKLIALNDGCCLESPVPISVYEYVKNAILLELIRISSETGHLHVTWKSRTIVHANVHSSNISLDEDNNAKLFNFSSSISIHESETLETPIRWTCGYMSPEFFTPSEVTEKIDVYSFGALLLEILAEGRGNNEQQQWQALLELALKCLETNKEQRPTMVEVTKQLTKIERASTTVREKEVPGRMLMEEFIASCDPHSIVSLSSFSAEEIRNAVDDYNPSHIFSCNDLGIWYKGHMGNLIISVYKVCNMNWLDHVKNEFRISIQLSSHKNVLKLLGYCLETPVPTLMYESAGATLLDLIPWYSPTPLRIKLKIARKIAKEVAYLHTALPLPLIHRNITSANIFLDERQVPKLCNFSQSISIHEGETLTVDPVDGTNRYMPPEYVKEGVITEKVDVYSFGVLLFDILLRSAGNGIQLFENKDEYGCFLDHHVMRDIAERHEEESDEQKVEAVVKLAFKCMETEKDERPVMREIARELKQIEVCSSTTL
ncbi:hypothetical protein P3X46_025786 [Hevea brasiliensis]|uniref:Protein kinase domain-containing protein n=1 Tax=Hevea brasiliensis TaxID=3981 RepID=A0ABQ9LA21_HEVBR|nr:hypothetical protein P3X46_025786 [Hevea brasiliensis]